MKPNLQTPPIKLFGDLVLLQGVLTTASGIVTPEGTTVGSDSMDLYIVAKGDGARVQAAVQIGDRVELVRIPKDPGSVRNYPKVSDRAFMLVGFDNILGVLTD